MLFLVANSAAHPGSNAGSVLQAAAALPGQAAHAGRSPRLVVPQGWWRPTGGDHRSDTPQGFEQLPPRDLNHHRSSWRLRPREASLTSVWAFITRPHFSTASMMLHAAR